MAHTSERDKLAQPKLGPPPRRHEEVLEWAQRLHEELATFYRRSDLFTVDKNLIGQPERRTVAATFSIEPDAPYIYLNSAGAVTSHATTAIKDGTPGQFLCLYNEGANNITMKHGANTVLIGAVDFLLTPGRSLYLLWNGSDWLQLTTDAQAYIDSAAAAAEAAAISAARAPVGALIFGFYATAPSGWLLLDGATLGEAGSGATHAGEEFRDLYIQLWDNLADAQAPVSGGRGASGTADFDAGKTLTMPDGRSRSPIGAGQGAGLTNRVRGITGGAETHVLSEAEMPSHFHTIPFSGNAGTAYGNTLNATGGSFQEIASNPCEGGESLMDSNTKGSGSAHNNMQPFLAANWIIKT